MLSKETEEIDRHIELALEIAKSDNKRAIASLELTLERSRSINYTHGIALSAHEMAAFPGVFGKVSVKLYQK